MTLLQLETSIKAWAENYDDTFVQEMGQLIRQAENRISTAVRLPSFSRIAELTLTPGQATTFAPADFLAADSVAIVGSRPLLKKDPEFIDEAFQGTTGQPRFYALQDDAVILWGPTPDATYYALLRYLCRPVSLVDSPDGTYISGTYPAALLSGCLWMASVFMKDWEGAQIHQAEFLQALGLAADLTYGPQDKGNYEKANSAVDGNASLGKRNV